MVTGPPVAVPPDTQMFPCRHALPDPQHGTGTHILTHWGTTALPLPAAFRPWDSLDPTHLEPTRPSKLSLELQSRLRLAMGRPWIDLRSFCGSDLSKDVAFRIGKGLSQSFHLKRKINYFLPSRAPAQDFVPGPWWGSRSGSKCTSVQVSRGCQPGEM